MDNQDENFILVGSLGRTIGLKGKIKLNSYTRPSENIKSYSKFFYKIDGTFKELKTQEISFSGKNLTISFEDIKSIEEAENLKNEEIFIVEGYMDVVTLHKYGIQNVVANLGTAMTEKQLDLTWKFFKNPITLWSGNNSNISNIPNQPLSFFFT